MSIQLPDTINNFLQKRDFDTLSVKASDERSNYGAFKSTNMKM